MKQLKICLDNVQYTSKPKQQTEIAGLSKRLGTQVKQFGRSDMIHHLTCIGARGQTFCPATFTNGIRKTENFEQMALLVLDFDDKISLDEVLIRAKTYELPILCIYETLTSENNNKFRAIFLNEVAIEDIELAQVIQNALITIFPEADKNCRNVVQMYFGGKKLLYLNEFISTTELIPKINIESLIKNMTLYLKDRYGNTHYKKHIARFANNNNLALNNRKMISIKINEDTKESELSINNKNKSPTEEVGAERNDNKNGKILPKSIIIYKDNGRNLPFLIPTNINNSLSDTNISSVEKNININNNQIKRTPYRSSILDDISNKCKLFNEFQSGSRRLEHDELFSLALTLLNIESGTDRFKKILKTHSYLDYYRNKKKNYWDDQLRYFKQNNYNPRNCNSFCRYKDTCSHSANILLTVKPKYGTMERIAGYEEKLYPLDEVVRELKENILSAVDANDIKIHVIPAPTAAGKTEISLDIMKDSGLKILYAAPTNILKDDVYRRAMTKGIKAYVTPSLHDEGIREQLPEDVISHIDYLYNSGFYRSVDSYIEEVANELDIECLKDYLKEKEKFRQYEGHVFTTHRKLQYMDEETLSKFDIIIIDEDFILKNTVPNQVSITITDLKKLQKAVEKATREGEVSQRAYNQIYEKIAKVLMSIETETLFKLVGFEWGHNEDVDEDSHNGKKKPIDGISTPIDIPSFCLAEKFCFRKAADEMNLNEDTIVFMKPAKLKKGFKYIIISATANEDIYNLYFGKDRVTFYECKTAEYKGTLNQFHNKSMSRSCIYNNPGIINNIKRVTRFKNTITFKNIAKPGELYYGNNEGVDTLKGQNIDVIGTPYYAEFIYKLFAYTIGVDFDLDAKLVPNLLVTHNGSRFHFTTYKDENLRKIQFWMIESDVEQAVGRARLLRFDCTVNLFSNFPLKQAVMKKFEYDNNNIR